MKFRALDAGGDWSFGQGIGSYAQNEAALALDIAARVRSIRGDCFFAPNDGVDYPNLLEKGRQQDLIAALSNAILQTSEVVRIIAISTAIDPKTRKLQASYTIQTIYSRSFTATLDDLTGAPN